MILTPVLSFYHVYVLRYSDFHYSEGLVVRNCLLVRDRLQFSG